jgi:hypothetical protein
MPDTTSADIDPRKRPTAQHPGGTCQTCDEQIAPGEQAAAIHSLFAHDPVYADEPVLDPLERLMMLAVEAARGVRAEGDRSRRTHALVRAEGELHAYAQAIEAVSGRDITGQVAEATASMAAHQTPPPPPGFSAYWDHEVSAFRNFLPAATKAWGPR